MENWFEEDKDLFFGPCPTEFTTSVASTMAHLLAQLGLFPSVGQAKKNGWDTEIPYGFTDIVVGKLKTRVTILKAY